MQDSGVDQDRAISCPRCGYDQRGPVNTWTDQCPLHGTCTECGLKFEWRELLSPQLTLPKWLVEAQRPWRFFPRQSIATFLRSFVPWRFWSAIRMSHPQAARRIGCYGLAFLVVLYVCFALSNGLMMWGVWRYMATRTFIVPSTGGWPVYLQGALLPLSNESIGQFNWTPQAGGRAGPLPYATPSAYFSYWSGAAPPLLVALSAQLVCGIAFALLPVSRRRAKVSWSHIIRVTAYGFALFVPAIVISMVSAGFTLGMMRGSGQLLMWLAVACWLALPIMLVIWWSTATSRYLRMPHPWAVGTCVVILGLLTPFTAVMAYVYLINPAM